MKKNPPVISVGNISLGGTGKTPFTIMLTQFFQKQGKKVCILSRGYKGKAGYDTTVISDGEQIFLEPPIAADEPYMMAKACPGVIVITGKERLDSYKLAVEKFQPDVVLLDDGFQHKRMPRDIDILLLDHRSPISTGLPFPFGYLREFPKGIARADIIIFTRASSDTVPKKIEFFIEHQPVFFSDIEFKQIRLFDKVITREEVRGYTAIAFSGIASGGKFKNFLERTGIYVKGSRDFADHHEYKDAEIEKIIAIKQIKNADLILTTEKDFVKIPEKYKEKIGVVEIGLRVNDYPGLFTEILKRLEGKI